MAVSPGRGFEPVFCPRQRSFFFLGGGGGGKTGPQQIRTSVRDHFRMQNGPSYIVGQTEKSLEVFSCGRLVPKKGTLRV